MSKSSAGNKIIAMGLTGAMVALTGIPFIGQILNIGTVSTQVGVSTTILASCDLTVRDFTGLSLTKPALTPANQLLSPKSESRFSEEGQTDGSTQLALQTTQKTGKTIRISAVAMVLGLAPSSRGFPDCTKNSEVTIAAEEACLAGSYESQTASAVLISKAGESTGNATCNVRVNLKKTSASIQQAGQATQIGTIEPH